MPEIIYKKLKPKDIDAATTIRLQSLGLNARRRVFGMSRPESHIKSSFNTDGPLERLRSTKTYIDYARVGGLAVASLDLDKQMVPVGYAMARLKQVSLRERFIVDSPVVLKEINIMPGFESEEVGSRLAKKALAEFKSNRSVEALIPEEDIVIGGLLTSLGLEPVESSAPVTSHSYFGLHHEPVLLKQYRAESVRTVIDGKP